MGGADLRDDLSTKFSTAENQDEQRNNSER